MNLTALDMSSNWAIFVILLIVMFIINLIIITYTFGPLMRYIVKPLYHKSWGKNHKKYRKEFNFLNLLEDGLILIYLLGAIPLVFVSFAVFVFLTFSSAPLVGNFFIDKIVSVIGAIVMAGFGWGLIEHEEHMKERAERKLKKKK